MVKAKVETKELPRIEEGIYDALFDDVELVETAYGNKWRWTFKIPLKDGIVTISGLTSTTFSRKGKAYKWVCAINGKKYKEGEEIDTDKLRGRPCKVEVVNKMYRDTEISNIANVMKKAATSGKKKGATA